MLTEYSNNRNRVFFITVAILIFIKLFLVGNSEIIGEKWDASNYAHGATQYYWFGDETVSMRPPGVSLFAIIFKPFGIPYRLGLEIFFIGGVWLIVSFFRGYLGSLPAILMFAFSVFHPWTFSGFTRFMSGPPFLVFLLLYAYCILKIFDQGSIDYKNPFLSLSGFTAAFCCLIRHETQLFLLTTIMVAVFLYLKNLRAHSMMKGTVHTLTSVFPMVLVFFGTLVIVSFINFAVWGFWGISQQSAGLNDLLNALHKIKVDDSVRHAPVTKKSFNVAFQLSPTFNQIRERILNPNHPLYVKGEQIVGKKEFGTVHEIWAIMNATKEIVGLNVPQREAFYKKSALEINKALKNGKYPSHAVALYPLDPNFKNWISFFPDSLFKVLSWVFIPKINLEERNDLEVRKKLFDQAANRRTALVKGQFNSFQFTVNKKIAETGWYIYVLGFILIVMKFWISPLNTIKHWEAPSIIMTLITSRILIYAVIDASGFPNGYRYTMLMGPLAAIMSVVVISYIITYIRRPHNLFPNNV